MSENRAPYDAGQAEKSEKVLREVKAVRNRHVKTFIILDCVMEKKPGWLHWYYQVTCNTHVVKSSKCRNITVARDLLHHPWKFCVACREIKVLL